MKVMITDPPPVSSYAGVRLTPRQQQIVRKAVEQYAGGLLQTAQRESERHARRLEELQREQQKLLHLFYKGSVAEEVLAAEQDRIEAERTEAHRWADAAAHDAGEVKHTLEEALKLLEVSQIAYRKATPHVRRLLNQALFDALLIRDEDVAEAKPAPWVAEIHRLAGSSLNCAEGRARQGSSKRNPDADFRGQGFSKTKMVREPGRHKNGQVQVEALVRALLEPLARRERQKLLGLLGEESASR
jgi:hypothetical protein